MVGLSVGGWSFICGIRFGSELATLRPLSSHREVDWRAPHFLIQVL